MKLDFFNRFSKKSQILNFTKIRPVGAEFHVDRHMDRRMDGRTNMTKLIGAFRNFANAPKTTGEKEYRRKGTEYVKNEPS